MHGGMGVTWELDIAHYFRRMTAIDILSATRTFTWTGSPASKVTSGACSRTRSSFLRANQELLWLTTLLLDLTATVTLYRLFGKTGLQVAIATAIILANLQGPKLTIIFGVETTLGVIFYSSIFFATDVLSENYGKAEANKAVRMGFAVSVIVLVMMSLALLYQPSTDRTRRRFRATSTRRSGRS